MIDEEYRVEYVMDRVRTFGTTWLGLTLECPGVHDHKFDPLTQREFYQLFAFFDRVPERGLSGFDPKVEVVSLAARRRAAELDRAIDELAQREQVSDAELAAWEQELEQAGGWQPIADVGDAARGGRVTALRRVAGGSSSSTDFDKRRDQTSASAEPGVDGQPDRLPSGRSERVAAARSSSW